MAQIDWSRYLNMQTHRALLKEQDPKLLKVARAIAPRGIQELLGKFGWQEIPRGLFPLAEGSLTVSSDQTMLGFQPDGTDGLCGVSITPGDEKQITSVRARIISSEAEQNPAVFVPEGSYQIVVNAPQPWTDTKTEEIVYYTADVMVCSHANTDAGVVAGTMVAFNQKQEPIGHMILNEWSQTGVKKYAVRHIPGIVFPEVENEKDATVLKLHSLNEERLDEVPDDAISGSGLIAVRFKERRIDITGSKARAKRAEEKRTAPWLEQEFAPQAVMMKAVGLTLFEVGRTDALTVERGGEQKYIGPPILLTVSSSPDLTTEPVTFENVSIREHRNPKDKYPSLQALARWGFLQARLLVLAKE